MKTGNIGIRNLADIGVADIDVYGTSRKKPASAVTPKLLMFFRSEDQAMGLPKEDKNASQITYPFDGQVIKKYPILDDLKYNQSFGFDLFRENLLKNKTSIYKIDEDTNGDYKMNGKLYSELNTGTLEMLYDKAPLSLELIDSGKTYGIDYDFKLQKLKGKKPLADKNYYAPNLLIKPDKEVKLSAKFFDTDSAKSLNVTVYFKLPNNKGIDSFTQSITFNQNEEAKEFKIKTKAKETVDAKTTIIAFIKDSNNKETEIGRLTILPNSLYQPKLVFVDVFYNKNTATSNSNYTITTKDINEKAFNQASLDFVLGKSQILNLDANDNKLIVDKKKWIHDTAHPLGQYLLSKPNTQDYETTIKDALGNPIDGLGEVLLITKSKFFENLGTQILQNIEKELQNFEVNDGVTTRKFLPPDKTLQDWFTHYSQLPDNSKAAKWYDSLVISLFDYTSNIPLAFYPLFMCNNIYSLGNDLAKGLMRAKGLIVPANGTGSSMTIAHELGHNLGLRHTFDKSNDEKGDLKIKPFDTLENIMDYLPDKPGTHNKNFITFQIDRIRENSARLKYSVDEMNFKIEKELVGNPAQNVIKDFRGNTVIETFSKDICRYLFDSYSGIYNLQDDTKLTSYRDKILAIFVDVIKDFFKNL